LKDLLKDHRKKGRFIVEIRFAAIPNFMDVRGEIISIVHPEIEKRCKHWKASDEHVLFLNDNDKPTQEFLIGMKRCFVALEDPGTMEEFSGFSAKMLGITYDRLGSWLKTITRFGVRFIEIVASTKSNYEETLSELLEKYHKLPFDIPLEYADSQAIIVHKYGRFGIGPTKKGDEWVQQIFKNIENVPDYGIAMDIDSYAKNISVSSKGEFLKAFQNVFNLTSTVEEMLARSAGVLDAQKA